MAGGEIAGNLKRASSNCIIGGCDVTVARHEIRYRENGQKKNKNETEHASRTRVAFIFP
jgi:hypothetical protein